MGRLRLILILLLILFLSWGFFKLEKTKQQALKNEALLKENLAKVEKQNQELEKEINYLKNPENLVRELKSQTNYTKVGEKLIILVPSPEDTNQIDSATTSTSTSKN